MDINESRALIDELNVSAPARLLYAGMPPSLTAPPPEASAAQEAGIQKNKLIAFTSGLDAEHKEAVKFSVQIAQSGADAAYDQLTQRMEWYAKYSQILQAAGWIGSDNKLSEYRNVNLEITMESVAMELIKLAAGPNVAIIAELTSLAIESLKGDTQLTQKLQAASIKGQAGSFDIMPCLQSEGDLVMYDHAMRFDHSMTSGGFLFWQWQMKNVSLQHVANERVLNLSHYRTVEQSIRKKLGDDSNDFFTNLKLD